MGCRLDHPIPYVIHGDKIQWVYVRVRFWVGTRWGKSWCLIGWWWREWKRARRWLWYEWLLWVAAGERNSGLSGAGWSGNLGSSRLTVYLILIQDRKMPTRLLISPAFIILPSLLIQSFGLEYIVGDSFWSIPTTNDFYTNWSSSHFFQTGDTLCKSNDLSLVQIEIRESIISIWGYNTLILALIRGFFCFCFSFFLGLCRFWLWFRAS